MFLAELTGDIEVLGKGLMMGLGMMGPAIGIGLVGFFYLKQINRTADFGESMLLSFLGLIGFLILYAIINSLTFKLIPHYLSSVLLPIILPMTGGVIGFNYKTRKLTGQIANE